MPGIEHGEDRRGPPVEILCDCGHKFERYRSQMTHIDGGVYLPAYKGLWYEDYETLCPKCGSKVRITITE